MLFYLLGCLSFENQFSLDDDGDGFTEYDGDCDDSDFNIGPEECQDNDGDTFSEYEGDCDDTDPKVYYNNLEKKNPVVTLITMEMDMGMLIFPTSVLVIKSTK